METVSGSPSDVSCSQAKEEGLTPDLMPLSLAFLPCHFTEGFLLLPTQLLPPHEAFPDSSSSEHDPLFRVPKHITKSETKYMLPFCFDFFFWISVRKKMVEESLLEAPFWPPKGQLPFVLELNILWSNWAQAYFSSPRLWHRT